MLKSMVLKLLFGILMIGGMTLASAAPFTLDENIKPLELKFISLKKHPDMLAAGATGTLGDSPSYIVMNGMTLQRQEAAILVALSDEPVTLEIVKDTWGDVLKSCAAEANDGCDVNFRTFGDAGFKISGAPGATYNFVLLASPEQPIEETLKSPVYPVGKSEINSMEIGNKGSKPSTSSGSSGDSSFQMIVIVLLVVLILVVLAGVVVMMKKKSTLQSILLLVFLSGSFLLHGTHAEAVPAAGSSSSLDGMTQAQINELEDDAAQRGRERDAGERTGKNIGDTAERMAKQMDSLQNLKALSSVWLSTCDVTGNPPGEPRIPSYCDGNEACTQCYSEARKDFNKTRAKLEKLRLIYSCSQKFSKAAIAFGDSSSGVHAVVGLAWQQQKMGILEAVKGLQAAYDNKYAELMSTLQKNMVDMGTCEQQFGVQDWYDRFGFVYYEFMKDKYKRAD
ncbi:MAG TPA: hypothetical protein VKA31_03760 [Mariprofundaceae bacterium]|nr:hypothetical protein [Mariprofundaceae bacterium]